MAKSCRVCSGPAQVKRPKTGDIMCKQCFYHAFEEEIHHTIVAGKLFTPGETVAIGASGGKDSTVLAHVMTVLNERHKYGLNLILLSVDEGITGYRDDSLETVKINQQEYGLPLKIVSYEELYGWTMDSIVKQIGLKNNCTYCGVFRRQALDRGAMLLKVDKIVTGHNADDIAETVIMNVLRGDIARLRRCTAVTTGMDGALPRCKPFKYTYEKDIVMYAFHKNLTYFSTECIYSPNAYRGFARAYIKDLERIQPSTIIDIIHSGESLCVKKDVRMPVQTTCTRCGYISSNELCKACVMLEGLNRGRPRLGIGKAHKERRLFNEELARQAAESETAKSDRDTTTTTTTTPTTPTITPPANNSLCCGGRGGCRNKMLNNPPAKTSDFNLEKSHINEPVGAKTDDKVDENCDGKNKDCCDNGSNPSSSGDCASLGSGGKASEECRSNPKGGACASLGSSGKASKECGLNPEGGDCASLGSGGKASEECGSNPEGGSGGCGDVGLSARGACDVEESTVAKSVRTVRVGARTAKPNLLDF